jgi:hypothetical protein
VAPDGSYVIGTGNIDGGDGARQFATDGTFLRQFGSGNIRGVAVVPQNRAWIGGFDNTSVGVFDLGSGASLGSISLTNPAEHAFSLTYLNGSSTVLVTDFFGERVVERDLSGTTIHRYEPSFITRFSHATWSWWRHLCNGQQ